MSQTPCFPLASLVILCGAASGACELSQRGATISAEPAARVRFLPLEVGLFCEDEQDVLTVEASASTCATMRTEKTLYVAFRSPREDYPWAAVLPVTVGANVAPPSDTTAAVRSADFALLTGLGIDSDELRPAPVTHAAERDEATGETSVSALKNIYFREVNGSRVFGQRAIVTRDLSGRVSRLWIQRWIGRKPDAATNDQERRQSHSSALDAIERQCQAGSTLVDGWVARGEILTPATMTLCEAFSGGAVNARVFDNEGEVRTW